MVRYFFVWNIKRRKYDIKPMKYIAEQMNGKTVLQNHSDGLEVIVKFPIIK